MWQSTKSKFFVNNEGITSNMLLYRKISTENDQPIVNLQATPCVVDRLLLDPNYPYLLVYIPCVTPLLLSMYKTLFLTNRIQQDDRM